MIGISRCLDKLGIEQLSVPLELTKKRDLAS